MRANRLRRSRSGHRSSSVRAWLKVEPLLTMTRAASNNRQQQ
jgi:hypothetical protein